ncbi:MAG: histone methylation protein DOT1-like protein [Pseudomonadota bacterium]
MSGDAELKAETTMWRDRDAPAATTSSCQRLEDVLEAMLQSLEGGEQHRRPLLDPNDAAFSDYIEIGIALRDCLRQPARRDYLITRLKPHISLIIGTLPAGIQRHGLLPELSEQDYQSRHWRQLEVINDAELRQWLIDDGRLIYGELKRHELENYFDMIAPLLPANSVMYDLGSGLGKVVMSAALSLPLARCVGVELLPYRHRMAEERLASMLAVCTRSMATLPAPVQPDAPLKLPTGGNTNAHHLLGIRARIHFIEQDMFAADLSDANLVFIYSTCFGSLMDALGERLAQALPENCLVSCTTFALKHPGFKLLYHYPSKTLAWTGVYLYQRVGKLETLPAAAPGYSYPPDTDKWEAEARHAFTAYDAQP